MFVNWWFCLVNKVGYSFFPVLFSLNDKYVLFRCRTACRFRLRGRWGWRWWIKLTCVGLESLWLNRWDSPQTVFTVSQSLNRFVWYLCVRLCCCRWSAVVFVWSTRSVKTGQTTSGVTCTVLWSTASAGLGPSDTASNDPVGRHLTVWRARTNHHCCQFGLCRHHQTAFKKLNFHFKFDASCVQWLKKSSQKLQSKWTLSSHSLIFQMLNIVVSHWCCFMSRSHQTSFRKP